MPFKVRLSLSLRPWIHLWFGKEFMNKEEFGLQFAKSRKPANSFHGGGPIDFSQYTLPDPCKDFFLQLFGIVLKTLTQLPLSTQILQSV